MMTMRDFVRATPFFVIAHRGASGHAPENTLAALRLAVASGARMIELDVQFTSDRKQIVFHDHVLGRTTNGHGQVKNTTFEMIRSLDAGAWFDPSFTGERVPSLEEALALLRDHVYLNIELKPITDRQTAREDIADLVATIKRFDYQQYMVFSSFDHDALRVVKDVDPQLHTVALNVPHDNRPPSEVVFSCSADGFGCSIHELTRARMADANAHLIPVGVYTVNTIEDLRTVIDLGARAVVSNYPDVIMEAYERMRSA